LTSGHIHRTAAAIERVNLLWCYACHTMDDGEACVDVAVRNDTALMKKCHGEEFICMVSAGQGLTTKNTDHIPLWTPGQAILIHHQHGELHQLTQDVVSGSAVCRQL